VAKLVRTPSGNHPLVDWGVFPHRDEDKGDWIIATWAAGQLAELGRERERHRHDPAGVPEPPPFFLAVGFFLPHVPCYATQRWLDLHPDDAMVMPPVKADDRDDLPRFASFLHWRLPEPRLEWLESSGQWRPLVRSYLACVSFVDSQVGRVLDALETSGVAGDTVVVLWSDHGWHLGEKGITGKNSLWERSTRVPLILAGPGVAANARCPRPVELLDLYPTLIELCGLPARDGLDGRSLAPQLKDALAPREAPAITTHNQNNHAVRTERWRYIRYADGSEELYDESADPNEWRNLAGDAAHAATIRDLARWMPSISADPVPGSADRLLTFKDGVAVWEGTPIGADEKMP
jgi:arylsulfatase A-like enzyme